MVCEFTRPRGLARECRERRVRKFLQGEKQLRRDKMPTEVIDGKTLKIKIDDAGHKTGIIPNGVTSDASGELSGALSLLGGSLKSIEVEDGNPSYKSVNGLLLTKDGATLLFVPGSIWHVTIPFSVKNISSKAFLFCSSLNAIDVEDGHLFYMSSSDLLLSKDGRTLVAVPGRLVSVKIPEGVTRFGCAFPYWSSVTSMTIPNSVTSIAEDAFDNCYCLRSIEVEDSNPYYKSVDGLLLTKDGKTLVAVPSGFTSVTIPDAVTRILSHAFARNCRVISVTIPDSVNSIEEGAFKCCSSLKGVSLPKHLKGILSENTFNGCSNDLMIVYRD